MTDSLPAPAAMPPGIYIQKRRLAAGFTIYDLALMIGGISAPARATVKNQLERLEAGDPDDYGPLVDQLDGAFRFDRRVYDALVLYEADDRAPVPPICRECGCSFFDPCFVSAGHGETIVGCAWAKVAPGEAPLCSACKGPEPDCPEAARPPAANDGEAADAA